MREYVVRVVRSIDHEPTDIVRKVSGGEVELGIAVLGMLGAAELRQGSTGYRHYVVIDKED